MLSPRFTVLVTLLAMGPAAVYGQGSGDATGDLGSGSGSGDTASAPSPSSAPASAVLYITVGFTASGDVSDYDSGKKMQIAAAIATEANVTSNAVSITVTSASVQITAVITVPAATATATSNSLASGIFANAASLTAFFQAQGITGVTVASITQAPTVTTTTTPFQPPSPPLAPPAAAGSTATPAAEEDKVCFPSSASVMRADGSQIRMDALKEGDRIVAATADGIVTTDTVSLFSLAKPDSEATFVALTTEAGATLTLTPDHHIPVGPSCCSMLKQARDVQVGETVHVLEDKASVTKHVVTRSSRKVARGLHSPLLTDGGFPVVDGVVTSFNTLRVVKFDALALPYVLPACKALGACSLIRRVAGLAECAYKTATGNGVCKTFHYIDGEVVRAGKSPTASAATSPASMAAFGATK